MVGLISYPLYLWHWPLLCSRPSSRATLPGRCGWLPSRSRSVLAWLTYEYVEKPIRFGKTRRRAPTALVGAMLARALAGGLLVVSDGWVRRLPPKLRTIATSEFRFGVAEAEAAAETTRHWLLDPDEGIAAFGADCIATAPSGTPRVWIVGDSHSDSFYAGLVALSDGGRRFALTQRSASACPPVVGFAMAKRPHCQAINDDTLRLVTASPPNVVVLSANWTLYDGGGWEKLAPEALSRTVSLLRAAGVRRVVVLGQCHAGISASRRPCSRSGARTARCRRTTTASSTPRRGPPGRAPSALQPPRVARPSSRR